MTPPPHEPLRAELLTRMATDQKMRNANHHAADHPADGDAVLHARMRQADRENAAWLATVVDAHGWPGYRMVGSEGAQAAWLLAQHADHDLAFQRHCVQLLTVAVEHGDANPCDLAYLYDRVAVHEQRPQLYGTQLRADACTPAEITNPERVDARRAAIGLMPLAAHLAFTQDHYYR